jgi:hypothetical protein
MDTGYGIQQQRKMKNETHEKKTFKKNFLLQNTFLNVLVCRCVDTKLRIMFGVKFLMAMSLLLFLKVSLIINSIRLQKKFTLIFNSPFITGSQML